MNENSQYIVSFKPSKLIVLLDDIDINRELFEHTSAEELEKSKVLVAEESHYIIDKLIKEKTL